MPAAERPDLVEAQQRVQRRPRAGGALTEPGSAVPGRAVDVALLGAALHLGEHVAQGG